MKVNGLFRDMFLMTLGGIIGVIGYKLHVQMVAIAEYRVWKHQRDAEEGRGARSTSTT